MIVLLWCYDCGEDCRCSVKWIYQCLEMLTLPSDRGPLGPSLGVFKVRWHIALCKHSSEHSFQEWNFETHFANLVGMALDIGARQTLSPGDMRVWRGSKLNPGGFIWFRKPLCVITVCVQENKWYTQTITCYLTRSIAYRHVGLTTPNASYLITARTVRRTIVRSVFDRSTRCLFYCRIWTKWTPLC